MALPRGHESRPASSSTPGAFKTGSAVAPFAKADDKRADRRAMCGSGPGTGTEVMGAGR